MAGGRNGPEWCKMHFITRPLSEGYADRFVEPVRHLSAKIHLSSLWEPVLMKLNVSNTLILFLGVALGVSLSIGEGVFAEKDSTTQSALPLDQLHAFSEVFEKVKQDYVEPVSDKKLLDGAIRGMLASLDPHSAYLDKEDYKELQVGTTGQFGGLGIEVGMEDGFVKVIAPIDDTPAKRAGVKAGDLVIRLDDKPVKGMTLKEAVDLMRGKPGTKITLTIIREGAEKPLMLTLTRDVIKVKSVKSRLLENGYGYVRITHFQSHTGESTIEAISDLKKKSKGKLKGLVLDLRNNPGGVLSAAVAVSDAFLNKGMIVYTEGRTDDAELKFTATPGDVLNGAPLVVLVNGGSASASEIVSGALQDQKRAVIMGQRTFGKGSVQTILPVGEGAALKLTTARYYTPSGRSIQNEGIVPDIKLEDMKVAEVGQQEDMAPLKEADLSHHLNNDKDPNAAKKAVSNDEKLKTLAKEDYQLYEALNLLKGLYLLQQRS
jgi:carboxyl-terminal processing protease